MENQNWKIIFRKRLVEYLDRRGMTQGELAWKIRVSRASVNAYINGVRVPSVPTIVNIAHALSCHVSDLVGVYDIDEY